MANWNNLEAFLETLHQTVDQGKPFCFPAKIITNAPKTELVDILQEETENRLKIKVSALPQKGEANKEIVRFFKKKYRVKAEILSGSISSLKLIRVEK